MTIQIRGYDIHDYNLNQEENNAQFSGVAHIESMNQVADVPFQGRHEKGMTGFLEFRFDDPDQINIDAIRERADEIRDVLAEHLLTSGYETGEYRDDISIT
ncbi:hypothetical protein [Ammoniphilus resinae]|uniref:Uncharacterized protein n=1 Tax=Ammoniphilus resinae TaxID=861532 RepID=A0ABS4GWR3_9BACL|nr:hypothetical protein [Ammoniphilus resinae]MBP1934704.1 hypothetical protein [Ammoniphilus resinae]